MSLELILNFGEEEFDKEKTKGELLSNVNRLKEHPVRFAIGADSFLKFKERLNKLGLENASYFVNKPISALSNAVELSKLYADLSRSKEKEALLMLSFSSARQLFNLISLRNNRELIESILEDYDFVRPIEFEPRNKVEGKFFPLLGLNYESDRKIIIAENYEIFKENKSVLIPSIDMYVSINGYHKEEIKNKEVFLMLKNVYDLRRASEIIR